MTNKPKDLRKKILGASGEEIAENYLTQKNYQIIARNFRNKFGEIDIIAQDGDFVVLVEVKTKQYISQGRPEEQVDWFKQKKLRLLARSLLKDFPGKNLRIDVVAVDLTLPNPQINHIINAVEG